MDSPAAPTHQVVWRFTTVDGGGLCVMMAGPEQTVMWLVVSLGFLVLPLQPVTAQVFLLGEFSLQYVKSSMPNAKKCTIVQAGLCSKSSLMFVPNRFM